MSKRSELAEILKSEYGIDSVTDLEKAIERIGSLDISPFCAEIKQPRREKHEAKKRSKMEKILRGAENDLPAPVHCIDGNVPAYAG